MPHLALAHFPIALLVTSGFLLMVNLVSSWQPARRASLAMFVAGAVMSIPTVAAGLFLAADHEGHHTDTLSNHRLLGIATAITAAFGVTMHWLRRKVRNADLMRDVMLLAATALAAGTGYLGGEMGHGGGHAERGGHGHGSAQSSPVDHHAPALSRKLTEPAASEDAVEGAPPEPSPEVPESDTAASAPASQRAKAPSTHQDDGHNHAH